METDAPPLPESITTVEDIIDYAQAADNTARHSRRDSELAVPEDYARLRLKAFHARKVARGINRVCDMLDAE